MTGEPMRQVPAGRLDVAVDLIQVRTEALAAADLVAEASDCAQLFARWTRRCAAPAADAAAASCRAVIASARREPAAAESFARAAELWQALSARRALLARERQAEHLIGADRPDDGSLCCARCSMACMRWGPATTNGASPAPCGAAASPPGGQVRAGRATARGCRRASATSPGWSPRA